MNNEVITNEKSDKPAISDEQMLRAVRAFEAIICSQISMKNKLGDDLKYAIRVGMIVLGLIAVSIMVLLLTLSSQTRHISSVVNEMNSNFTNVTMQMDRINESIQSMSIRVTLLSAIDEQTQGMNRDMTSITADMKQMQDTISSMSQNVTIVGKSVSDISNSISYMNAEVQNMSNDMRHMAQPANSMLKMFPMMP